MRQGCAPLRAAVVGFGRVAEKAHLPAFLQRGVEVLAVADGSADRLNAAGAALPGARLYESFEALLKHERGLDFIDIATPPFLHAEQALAAVKAGMHVLCEKPLGLAPDELEALRRSSAMAGRTVFTVHNWAHSPQWRKIFELAASGAVGAVRHVELRALRTRPAAGALSGDWRRQAALAGGGILVDHGWHNLYLIERLIGQAPRRLAARLSPACGGVDEEAALFIEFPNATAQLSLTWRSPVRRNAAVIVGSAAVLELNDDELLVRSPAGVERFSFAAPLSAGSAHPSWFSDMLSDFFSELSDASLRGRNLKEASFCLSVIHRAYQSVRQGRGPARTHPAPRGTASR
ncbi:MAG: Gfo/Idh/MocA family oxidoreductase [Elusimicrobia bacterium]|nr:Gfo/Idh/MocA family oxidoreductase [Elusimicrobiota bacterium]MDE2237571.1 Gfo/Idh/MocA family oxidoreductase [Elusimicrobiota bacterium]MDE2424359.1 Gfo/Idh/MocA family oxidoreductase [Elusimicrobiota bacterium]